MGLGLVDDGVARGAERKDAEMGGFENVGSVVELGNEFVGAIMNAEFIGSGSSIETGNENIGPGRRTEKGGAEEVWGCGVGEMIDNGGKNVHLAGKPAGRDSGGRDAEIEGDVGLLVGQVRVVKEVAMFKELLAMIACENDKGFIGIGEMGKERAEEAVHVVDRIAVAVLDLNDGFS